MKKKPPKGISLSELKFLNLVSLIYFLHTDIVLLDIILLEKLSWDKKRLIL